MKEHVSLNIPSHPKFLSLVRDVAVRMGKLSGMTEAGIEEVKLAVDEACANVIKHAYKGDTGKRILIRFKILKKGFEVVIEDGGLKPKIELLKGRSLDDIRPGGLGIHLIKKAFQVYEFDERKVKGNRLRLFRHLGDKDDNRTG
jgi:anti-sigma regulatory factor (Ser/Thr protein kinase)